MSETEIDLARAYLEAAAHDPVGALIRSVRDLARARRLLASGAALLDAAAAGRNATGASRLPAPARMTAAG